MMAAIAWIYLVFCWIHGRIYLVSNRYQADEGVKHIIAHVPRGKIEMKVFSESLTAL